MKPSFASEDVKVKAEMGLPEQNQRPSSRSNRKWLVRLTIVVTLLVTITGLVLGSLYFGIVITREHKKETWVQYTGMDGQLVDEKITVTKTEEDYETPTMRAIYDFETMLITYKFSADLSGSCYVSRLNSSLVDSPDKVYSNLTEGWDTNVPHRPTKQIWSSGIEVPRELLSPRGRDMCKFSSIYWLIEMVKEDGLSHNRTKRASDFAAEHCCCTCGRCCPCRMQSGASMKMDAQMEVGGPIAH